MLGMKNSRMLKCYQNGSPWDSFAELSRLPQRLAKLLSGGSQGPLGPSALYMDIICFILP